MMSEILSGKRRAMDLHNLMKTVLDPNSFWQKGQGPIDTPLSESSMFP